MPMTFLPAIETFSLLSLSTLLVDFWTAFCLVLLYFVLLYLVIISQRPSLF